MVAQHCTETFQMNRLDYLLLIHFNVTHVAILSLPLFKKNAVLWQVFYDEILTFLAFFNSCLKLFTNKLYNTKLKVSFTEQIIILDIIIIDSSTDNYKIHKKIFFEFSEFCGFYELWIYAKSDSTLDLVENFR